MGRARPGLGAALKDALRSFTPGVRWLILANGVIFIAMVLFGAVTKAFMSYLALDPEALVLRGRVWQLLSFQFLHGGAWHVFWNMYAVFFFGRWLEEKWGTRSFVTFFLGCGVGAGVLHVLLALFGVPQAQGPVIGASGGVYALLVAAAMIWPHRKILLFFILPIELRFAALLAVVLTLFTAFDNNGVAAFAHLGGMLTGWLWLKHGWRVARFLPERGHGDGETRRPGLRERFDGWRRKRRMKRFAVVEEDWEDWLRGELDDDDETRH